MTESIHDKWAKYKGLPVNRENLESILYDKAYSWELQPGSDVPATCVGVLPKVLTALEEDWYAGLVTVAAGAPIEPGSSLWFLLPASTSIADMVTASGAIFPPAATPPGVYLAAYICDQGDPPPYAFPAGWTPGNTTGSGPVLPLMAQNDNGFDWYAGLVYATVGAPLYGGPFFLAPATTALDAASFGAAPSPADPLVAWVYLALAKVTTGDPAPTLSDLPTGWTFRPYGIGPIAITDENAGGLIGDVAYVVSGYVYNLGYVGSVDSRYVGELTEGTHSLLAGDVFKISGVEIAYVVTSDGDIVVSGGGTLVGPLTSYSTSWPFIERYDLATKKWLPRIPLPVSDIYSPGDRYAAEGGIAGVINQKLYFGGGDGYASGVEFFVYDPTDDSITRLDDIVDLPGSAADYVFYGVVADRLWALGYASGTGWYGVYDPATAEWSAGALAAAPGPTGSDQVQGFEIDGKLWFVTGSQAYVFDPVALTVTNKATRPAVGGLLRHGLAWAVGSKIYSHAANANGGAAVYDTEIDTWTPLTSFATQPPTSSDTELVLVVHDEKPYLMSAAAPFPEQSLVGGVFGLTGVAIDKPRAARLQDVADHVPDTDWVWATFPSGDVQNYGYGVRYRRVRGIVFVEGSVVFAGSNGSLVSGLLPLEFWNDNVGLNCEGDAFDSEDSKHYLCTVTIGAGDFSFQPHVDVSNNHVFYVSFSTSYPA